MISSVFPTKSRWFYPSQALLGSNIILLINRSVCNQPMRMRRLNVPPSLANWFLIQEVGAAAAEALWYRHHSEVRGTKLKVQTRPQITGICCCCCCFVPTFLTYQRSSFVSDTMWTVLKFCLSLKWHSAVIDSRGGGSRGEQEER